MSPGLMRLKYSRQVNRFSFFSELNVFLENVVVCQFDKIQRVRNKWRFHLKDGIMSLNGKDFVFQKATGDGEW